MNLFSRMAGLAARWRSWMRAVSGRERLEAEMDAELAHHVEKLTADLVREGHAPEDAARRARVALGGATVHKEGMRAALGLRWGDELAADLRYGVRMLRKSPAFTAIAVGSLALGIGANTAIFSVAKKVMFDTLPVSRPHELRMLRWVSGHEQPVPPSWGDVYQTENGGLAGNAFSYRVVEELRRRSDAIADVIAFKDVAMTATIDGQPEVVASELVSGDVFDALGIAPVLGRGFTQAEDAGRGKDLWR